MEKLENEINNTSFSSEPGHHSVYKQHFNSIDLFDKEAARFRYFIAIPCFFLIE